MTALGLPGDDIIPAATAQTACSAMKGPTNSAGMEHRATPLLVGGDDNDLLSGDARMSIWKDVPFIGFRPAEPGLPAPVGGGLGGVGGNDILDAGAGDDILVGDAPRSPAPDVAAMTFFSAARATIAYMATPTPTTPPARPGSARSCSPTRG